MLFMGKYCSPKGLDMAVLCLFVYCLFLNHIAAVSFIEDPSDLVGLEHQKVLLNCRFSTNDNSTTIIWFHDKSPVPLEANSDYEVDEVYANGITKSSIGFHLLYNTQGKYYCNSSTPADGWINSKPASIKIAFLNDHFILEPQDKIVSVGETVLLECIPPIGLPKPSIRWSKGNETLILTERMHLSETGSLRIDRVSWKDAGVYVCSAESFASRRSSGRALLTVRHRPYFVESPLSLSVPVYSAFELLCRAAGEPQPVIFWRREPPLLNIPFERTRLSIKGALQFIQVRLEDAGDYICRAVSAAGIIEAIAHVDVVSPPRLVLTPPSLVSAMQGVSMELICSADGSPSPDIRWLRSDPVIYYSSVTTSSSDRIFVSPQGSLIIQSVRPSDASIYECRASSPVGLTRSLTSVKVLENPSLEPARFGALSPPVLIKSKSKHSINAHLICGFPSTLPTHAAAVDQTNRNSNKNGLSITWRVNGVPLQNSINLRNRTVVDPSGSLRIYDVSTRDQANYTCIIFNHNSQRYATWIIHLQMKNDSQSDTVTAPSYDISLLPKAPSNLTVVAVGATWLKFKWVGPVNEAHRFGYKLFYLPISSKFSHSNYLPNHALKNAVSVPHFDQWLSTVRLFSDTSGILTNLSPNTGYWVEIRGVNQFGLSAGCLSSSIVYTSERTSTSVDLSEMNYTNSFHSPLIGRESSLLNPGRTVDFQDLSSKFRSIKFKDMFIRSLTATELMITWMAHSSSNILQQIDGFKLNVKPVRMSRCLVTASQASSVDQQEIPSYLMYGDPATSSIHCSLSSDFLLERVLRMSTTISSASSDDSPINSLHPTSKSFIVPRRTAHIDSKAVAISGGLLPFTCYELDIAAFKDDHTYGRIWSPPSRPHLALTLDAPPSHAPTLLAANWLIQSTESRSNQSSNHQPSIYNHRLRLQWKPLDLQKAHGALLGYVVHLLGNTSGSSMSVKVSADVIHRDIFGLNPRLEYTIYLAGITCRGEGVRGPGYQLLPKMHVSDEWFVTENSLLDGYVPKSFPSWAYGLIIAVVLFWIILGAIIPVLHRRRFTKPRFHPSSHQLQIDFNHNESNLSNNWISCFHTAENRRSGRRERHTTLDPSAKFNIENSDIASKLTETQYQVEMAYLLKHSLKSHHTSSGSDRVGSGAEDTRNVMGFSTSGSNSKSDRSTQKLSSFPKDINYKDEVLLCGEAEVYANSDPSLISGSHSPANIPTPLSLRPTLPESIDIPFPVPPEQRDGNFLAQLIGNHHTADCVPPYASCNVSPNNLPIYHSPVIPGSNSAQPGLVFRQPYEGGFDVSMRGYQLPHILQHNEAICLPPLSPYDSRLRNVESDSVLVDVQQQAVYRPPTLTNHIASAHCPIPPPPTYPPPPLPATARSMIGATSNGHSSRNPTSSSSNGTNHFVNPYATDRLYDEQSSECYFIPSSSSNVGVVAVPDDTIPAASRDTDHHHQQQSVMRMATSISSPPPKKCIGASGDYEFVQQTALPQSTKSTHCSSSSELSVANGGLGSTGHMGDPRTKFNRSHAENTQENLLSGSDFSTSMTQLKPINSPTQLSVSPIQLFHTPTASVPIMGMELLSSGELHVSNPHSTTAFKTNGQMPGCAANHHQNPHFIAAVPFDRLNRHAGINPHFPVANGSHYTGLT